MIARIVNHPYATWLIQLLHWLLPIASLIFIFILVDQKMQNQAVVNFLSFVFSKESILLFCIIILSLTIANVGIESLRWKTALSSNYPIRFSDAFKQTMMGFTSGFITPFRSGVLVVRMKNNQTVSRIAVINSSIKLGFAQFLATTFFTLTGLVILFISRDKIFELTGMLFIVIISFFVFRKRSFKLMIQKWDLKLEFDKKVFVLSLIRYIIFSLQYLFILIYFGVESDYWFLYSLITFSYFVNTLIPAGALGKLGVRELSGILIIGESTGFVLETACAAFFIWILNQALPAIFGSGYYFNRLQG